jgi:hypothetical protein
VEYVKPEQAFELGYRSFIEGFSVDVNGYYNIYNDFIGNLNVVAPLYGTAQDSQVVFQALTLISVCSCSASNFRAFQLYTNTKVEIKSLGFGLGLSRKVYQDFEVGVNYNYAEFFDQAKTQVLKLVLTLRNTE